ncbi:MAG: hypothetical protein ACJ754_13905 [Pyrinomonadaceae bacterium]
MSGVQLLERGACPWKKTEFFDEGMTLGEAVKWLGRRLPNVRRDASEDLKRVWRVETRLVKAEGRALSYRSTTEEEGADPSRPGYRKQELWTLDLRGLDPLQVNEVASGQVFFMSAGDTGDSIRTAVYSDETLLATYHNRRMGHFTARDEASARELAAALRRVVGLCRQGRP